MMSAMVHGLMQRDAASQALTSSATALLLLGALSSKDALSTIAGSGYNPNTVAEYDLYHKILYVQATKGRFTPLDLAVISHEYERALQDHYFNLGALLTDSGNASSHNADARLARAAVVEGDAFTTMLSYAATFDSRQRLQFTQQLQRSAQPAASDYLHDAIGFPASQGTTFVTAIRAAAAKGKMSAAARQAAGNNAVDQALRAPPASTAQVLNPALYLQHTTSHEAPLPVPDAPLGAGWMKVDSDVMGAYGIDDLLQEHAAAHSATAQAADQAAAGWQSDRWVVYQRNKDTVLVWYLRFSSAGAATSFVHALTDYTAARFHTTLMAQSRLDWRTTGYAMGVRQHNVEIAVAIGSDKALLSQCDQALKALGFS
ncbi:MAG TPA: hypothetical protein VHB98_14850 [Chloroflexota bacterium]|nr:hypothetical protein [Chloroflexota bacterium]